MDGLGRVQPGRRGQPAVPRVARDARPREGGDDPRGADLPDHVVVGIGDIQLARWRKMQTLGMVEPCRRGGTPIPQVAGGTRPRVGRDDSGRGGYLPDLLVRAVANVEVPVGRHLDSARGVEPRGRRGAAVSRGARGAVPRDRRDDAGGRGDLPDHVVPRIRDIDVPVRIERDVLGGLELGGRGQASVARVARGSRASDRRDDAGAVGDFADGMVVRIGEIEIAVRRDPRRPLRILELGRGGGAAVSGVARDTVSGVRRDPSGKHVHLDRARGPRDRPGRDHPKPTRGKGRPGFVHGIRRRNPE